MLGKPTRLTQPVKHSKDFSDVPCAIVSNMQSAKKCCALDFMSLPEDILVDIVSRLDDRHQSRLEAASKRLCCAMSRYNSTWPRKKQLDLRASSEIMPLSPDNFTYPLSLQALRIGAVLPGCAA